MGKDKTDVERMRSVDALHIKLLNTGLKEWHQRQSKVLGALFPILEKDEDAQPVDNARSAQRLYQRSMALYLVCLEVCARKGIRVTHKYPPACGSAYASHMRRICEYVLTSPPLRMEDGSAQKYHLWPKSWLFCLDRDEACHFCGVHRAYAGTYAPLPQCCRGDMG